MLCLLSSYRYLSTVRVTVIAIDATQVHLSVTITLTKFHESTSKPVTTIILLHEATCICNTSVLTEAAAKTLIQL